MHNKPNSIHLASAVISQWFIEGALHLEHAHCGHPIAPKVGQVVCRYSGVPCRFNSISAEKREEMGGKETPTTSFTAFPSWDRLFSRSSLPGNGRAVRKSVRTNSPSTPPEGDRPHLAEPSLSSMLPDGEGGSASRRGSRRGRGGPVAALSLVLLACHGL